MPRRPDLRSREAEQYRPLYKTARWRKLRDAQLQSQPLCEWCKARGRIVEATVCHHNDPKQKASPATFFLGPYTSLCAPCHDREAQQIERIGYSKAVGEDGWPSDENHPCFVGVRRRK